jgi:hypothetical protein
MILKMEVLLNGIQDKLFDGNFSNGTAGELNDVIRNPECKWSASAHTFGVSILGNTNINLRHGHSGLRLSSSTSNRTYGQGNGNV